MIVLWIFSPSFNAKRHLAVNIMSSNLSLSSLFPHFLQSPPHHLLPSTKQTQNLHDHQNKKEKEKERERVRELKIVSLKKKKKKKKKETLIFISTFF
ncbi:hypothetical protein HYC85_015550 [Camellia sinensis]|uniref:Uncharacterized protein n=1 Tax=Camellia sinensis TaxID=4442 RepID=A0A7J7GX14_CAMSI|nr:hypothetical protein HYC85_015550 [Camellia sinensis]